MARHVMRRPSRAAVARSLAELAILWRPPDEKDNARRAPGAGESETELSTPDSTPTSAARKAGT